jgi:hypothetical protein
MTPNYTGPERRRRPAIHVPEDIEGIRTFLLEHLIYQADTRAHFDERLTEIKELLHTQAATASQMAPAVAELTTILSGFQFLKKTAILIASVVGSAWAFWHAIKDYVRFP